MIKGIDFLLQIFHKPSQLNKAFVMRLNYACTKMTYDLPRETEPWGVWGVIMHYDLDL